MIVFTSRSSSMPVAMDSATNDDGDFVIEPISGKSAIVAEVLISWDIGVVSVVCVSDRYSLSKTGPEVNRKVAETEICLATFRFEVY
ncbi:hypothetical protein AU106_gp185 [Sinorhizobium phage phiM9]|uniref:Uncharacterized protein n=1 Tax=Sinorhizobium phage phiM9 TaxID=1636182 RepID=A0A0F6TH69_9CAUD|nr:hypothetical protein AU106_gp185 [Sinorhizobium phage phiM9]AKE44816.1 hypothetical protein Sm_phiM9_189 [Sinorhizobium phage phiM9]